MDGKEFKGVTYMQKRLGIFMWFGYRIPVPERVRIIRETGFETVLHWWEDLETEGFTKEEQVYIIRKEGLEIENAHLQFNNVNHLWLDTLDGQAVFEGYLSDIDGLANHDIPIAVFHLTSGKTPPLVSDIGMYRIRKLLERAEKHDIQLAMENVRDVHILNHVLDLIKSPMLGLCYDSGHDYIWSPAPYELLEKYKDRIFAVHLHDNMGQNDDHLAPGKGEVNWNVVREGIENSVYMGAYTLECDSTENLVLRTPLEHLMMCYENACRVL